MEISKIGVKCDDSLDGMYVVVRSSLLERLAALLRELPRELSGLGKERPLLWLPSQQRYLRDPKWTSTNVSTFHCKCKGISSLTYR